MADDKFKLPRSSYEEICKIIKAYGRLATPASLEDVAKLCAMNKTAISANNAFLANIELIEGGRAKAATQKGNELAKALEHELPDEIQDNWALVVGANEFLEKMAVAVKIRGKMEISALESHVAYSAGEAKSKPVMTGARAVVDILRAAGVVLEHDGQLVSSEISTLEEETSRPSKEVFPVSQDVKSAHQILTPPQVIKASGTSLHIELRIDVKPSELDGLGKKIGDLLRELENPGQEGDDELENDS